MDDARTTGSIRVFFLDDDADAREPFAEFLRMDDFQVDEFESAEDALRSIERAQPRVMVMDITLQSGIDGYEAARRIRASDPTRAVRLVAMTGHSAAAVRSQGDLFDAILTKPVNPSHLVELVKRLSQ